MDLNNKKVLVSGLAKSGVASALLLKRMGAEVTAQDLKAREDIEEVAALLEQNQIQLYLGKNPDEIVGGFDLLIISPGIPIDLPFVVKAKELGIPVWGEIELASRVCHNPIIAITGTNGKTTTTALVGEIMKKYAPGSQIVGNIGTPFAGKVESLPSDTWVVAEISSFQMETAEAFHPRVAAVLNVTPDHIVRHKNMETYIAMKERIFANQTADDFLILNYDNEICRGMAEKAKARKLFFSRVDLLDETLGEGIFVRDNAIYIKWDNYDEQLFSLEELPIPGAHNVENIMAAAGCAICAGVGLDIIRKSVLSFGGVEHRIEYIRTLDGVKYYNDSKATNTDAAIKALESFQQPILLIGGGYDKGVEFRDWVGLFAGRVKLLAILGDTADKIIETCKQYSFSDYERVNTLKDAVSLCRERASEGDIVLLSPACASFDMFDSYEQRGEVFKEFINALEP